MFQITWAYVLNAVYNAARGVMKVDGRFAFCGGNGCDRIATATAKEPFHTELKMNDHLVDTHMTNDPSDDLEFVRVSGYTDRADEAKTALATWLKILDAGDFGQRSRGGRRTCIYMDTSYCIRFFDAR